MKPIKAENTLYDEYEELLLERDRIRKEAGQIWTLYIQTFGQLMTDVFKEKVACIRQKKLITYYQMAANRGKEIDADALEKQLDREMAVHLTELHRMLEEHKRCAEARTSTLYEVERSKVLYRRLAKLLHPDIHPETDREEVLRDLWARITEAYGHNDVRALSELEVLARKALNDLAADGVTRVEIPDLEERIRQLKKEIADIQSRDPYTYREILEDADAVEKKKQELRKELEIWQGYHREMKKAAENILREGGVTLKWRMN